MNISLVWIRNDLRLEDNTALIEAIKDVAPEDKIGMVFCIDPKQLKTGSYSHDYFFTALHTFYRNCLEKKLVIYFLYGDPQDCFSKLIKEFPNIRKIYFNIDDSGYGMLRDYAVKKILEGSNIRILDFYDHHLHSANEVLKEDGSHYKVFTPYYNQWKYRWVRPMQKLDYDKLRKVIRKDFEDKCGEGQNKFREILQEIKTDFVAQTGEEKPKKSLRIS